AAGIPHGAYFGVASLLAASLMGPGSQGKGVAVALSGLTFANLAGVPLMTALGQVAGWRTVYLVIAGIFAATVLALRWAVPAQPVVPGRRAVDELLALRRVQLWVVMGIAAVGFAGGFAVFSYVADITTRVSGASAGMVPWVLAAAGLGMTLGNVLGGMTTDRSLRGTLLLGFPVYIAALVGLFLAAPGSLAGLIIGLFAVNAANSVLNPALQTWLIRVAHRSEVLGASLNHAAFNVANALGAALGGAVIAGGLGFRAPMVVAILLASTGLVLVLTTLAALRSEERRVGGESLWRGAGGEDGIRARNVTGVQTCALPICRAPLRGARRLPQPRRVQRRQRARRRPRRRGDRGRARLPGPDGRGDPAGEHRPRPGAHHPGGA